MKIIYKYNLEVADVQAILMPPGAEILSLQIQHGLPVIWTIIDSEDTRKVSRHFIMVGTGHDFSEYEYGKDSLKFIGTIQISNGVYVFHVFERV